METRLPRRLQFGCKSLGAFVAVFFLLGAALVHADEDMGPAPASEPSSQGAYEMLETKADAIQKFNHETGWAYIISGGITLGVSIPAYYLSTDVFAEAVYSVGQTLGVAAVGYGSYLVLIDDDYARYRRLIDETPGLTRSRKEVMAREFLVENAERARSIRKIRVITHGLTSALNFLSAATTTQSQLRTALLFVGGINLLAALSFGLTYSEEENVAQSLHEGNTPAPRSSVDFIVGPTTAGPVAGVSIRF